MARLDGEHKSPTPWIVAIALFALLGLGSYFLLQNRTPREAGASNADRQRVHHRADSTLAGSSANATPGSNSGADSTSGATYSATPGATSMAGETAVGETNTSATAENSTSAHSATISGSGGVTNATPQDGNATEKGTAANATSNENNTNVTDGPVRKRSKTITNHKTGTTTTYSKEVHSNGEVSRAVTRTPAAP